jgi:hypothetical protein
MLENTCLNASTAENITALPAGMHDHQNLRVDQNPNLNHILSGQFYKVDLNNNQMAVVEWAERQTQERRARVRIRLALKMVYVSKIYVTVYLVEIKIYVTVYLVEIEHMKIYVDNKSQNTNLYLASRTTSTS